MYEVLKQHINNGSWTEAEQEFQQCLSGISQEGSQWDDEFAILAAVVYDRRQESDNVYDSLIKGLRHNHKNCELYLLLGAWYERTNRNQAYLCYENAAFYSDKEDDLAIINQFMDNLLSEGPCDVRPSSIVILSYENLDYTKGCIKSIRNHNPPTAYELIVVDNGSKDGSQDWLKTQKDITLLCNEENKGFPMGCNQGIKIAEPDNDIFLLNNDTVLTPNSLFWLRMGLYEAESVGATGSVSNFVSNYQNITESYKTLDEYIAYGTNNNIPMRNPYEKKIYLVGFAMLIKRKALDEVGLLDLRFSPGTYEDNDFGLRLLSAGWQQLLCWNSFIFHYGSGGGMHLNKWNLLYEKHAVKLADKWKFQMKYYQFIRQELIQLITAEKEEAPVILEIGCGLGSTLARIQYLWPRAVVKGMELDSRIAELASRYLDVIQGDIETIELPWEKGSIDYIILGDVLEHLHNPQKTLERLKPYLKEEGCFLCSIPNILHTSVIGPLLQGVFEYGDAGILDRTHLKFFTLDSIQRMFEGCGLYIENVFGTSLPSDENNLRIIEELCEIPGIVPKEQFLVYQYIFKAGKGGS